MIIPILWGIAGLCAGYVIGYFVERYKTLKTLNEMNEGANAIGFMVQDDEVLQ